VALGLFTLTPEGSRMCCGSGSAALAILPVPLPPPPSCFPSTVHLVLVRSLCGGGQRWRVVQRECVDGLCRVPRPAVG
jgi:hypothetical protein